MRGGFAPYQDLAIVGAGGEDVAEFRVSLWQVGRDLLVTGLIRAFNRELLGRGEDTHETHHTAPSCLLICQ